jgi:hypothetical protein
MNPKNPRKVTAEEALEQTRRNRLRAAILESRSGPVLPEDVWKPVNLPKASTAAVAKRLSLAKPVGVSR